MTRPHLLLLLWLLIPLFLLLLQLIRNLSFRPTLKHRRRAKKFPLPYRLRPLPLLKARKPRRHLTWSLKNLLRQATRATPSLPQ